MNEVELYIKIGQRIKYLREYKNLTQEKLAEKSNLSLDYIGKIEVNINHPGLKSLIKISKALEVDIIELFNFDNKFNLS